MNKKVIVFAGTEEGRRICEYLTAESIDTTACIATSYGRECLSHISKLKILEGRLSEKEMKEIIHCYDYVVDATHPFATMVSENIKNACGGRQLIRIVRTVNKYDGTDYFDSLSEVCDYLNTVDGNVLATTGSKELLPYTTIKDYQERVFIRVLPSVTSIEDCIRAGIKSSNIIAMQGPFSEEMNVAMMHQIKAEYLVTKETGRNGGYEEKLSAAHMTGARALVVGSPGKEDGLTIAQAKHYFRSEFRFTDESGKRSKGKCFPLFITLKGKKIVMVGGGKIAERRIKSLISFADDITVIAPEISREIKEFENTIRIAHRVFEENDLNGAYLVLAATNDRKVNRKIFELCRQNEILVNVCDKKDECDFYFPAIFSDKSIIGGIVSQSGDSHNLVKDKAQQIRDFLERR